MIARAKHQSIEGGFELAWSGTRDDDHLARPLSYVVSFMDARSLRRHVLGLNLPADQLLKVSRHIVSGGGKEGVYTTSAAIARWRPTVRPMPDGTVEDPRPARPNQSHGELLRRLRTIFRQAVVDGLITIDRADALMFALDEVLRPDTAGTDALSSVDRVAGQIVPDKSR